MPRQDKKPKYIAGLMAAAQLREREDQLALDWKLQMELREEKEQCGDTEKFVTGAYKKRLQVR